jgi:hypothetical protein
MKRNCSTGGVWLPVDGSACLARTNSSCANNETCLDGSVCTSGQCLCASNSVYTSNVVGITYGICNLNIVAIDGACTNTSACGQNAYCSANNTCACTSNAVLTTDSITSAKICIPSKYSKSI